MKQLVSLLLGGTALCSYAANPATDSAIHYKNPWGPNNPQNRAASGFAPWIFSVGTPSPKTPFKIDTSKPAFAIPMSSFSGVYVSFTGDGQSLREASRWQIGRHPKEQLKRKALSDPNDGSS